MAGSSSDEVPVHQDVLLQELPEHRKNEQLHQLSELLPAKGTWSIRAVNWQIQTGHFYTLKAFSIFTTWLYTSVYVLSDLICGDL